MTTTVARETRVAQPSVRRVRRRPGRLPAALFVLLFLGLAVVAADRVGAMIAADHLKSRIADELHAREVSYHALDVTIDGTPFLTQVAEGRYESITIELTDAQLRSESVEATLPALHVVATGVHADAAEVARGEATVMAEQVVGNAVISYAGLNGLVDLSDYYITDVAFQERDGALYATGTVSVVGLNLPIEAAADVTLQGGVIHVQLRDARAVGMTLPDQALDALDRLANNAIVANMPPLPFDITLDALTVTPDGLAITATGRGVTLVAG